MSDSDTKHNQVSDGDKNFREKFINERWAQLQRMTLSWTDVIGKYLFLTNAGGAVAVLSFMGNSVVARNSGHAKASLLVFCLGIVTVGFYNATSYYRVEELFQTWKHSARGYLANQSTWKSITDADDKLVDAKRKHPEYLAWAAFILFMTGLVLGGLGLGA